MTTGVEPSFCKCNFLIKSLSAINLKLSEHYVLRQLRYPPPLPRDILVSSFRQQLLQKKPTPTLIKIHRKRKRGLSVYDDEKFSYF